MGASLWLLFGVRVTVVIRLCLAIELFRCTSTMCYLLVMAHCLFRLLFVCEAECFVCFLYNDADIEDEEEEDEEEQSKTKASSKALFTKRIVLKNFSRFVIC